MNLERNHVVFVAILFSCQGTDVRERGGNPARPSRPCQAAQLHPVKPIRLTRTRLPLSICCWKRSAGSNCLRRLQGPGSVRPRRLVVNYRKLGYQLCDAVDYSEPRDRRQPDCPHCYSSLFRAAQPAVQIRVMACFPKIPYRSGTSRNDPTPGPIPPISVPPPDSRNRRRLSPCRERNRTTLPAEGAAPRR